MKASLVGSNATVLAQFFNPSIFRDSWFINAGLITADDVGPNFLFTPQAVQLPTTKFTIVVVPQQLQFVPAQPHGAGEVVAASLGAIIAKLAHTPFSAVGVNFIFHILPEREAITASSRRLFMNSSNPLAAAFGGADAQFGAYMSKDVAQARLKLDIKPVNIVGPADASPILKVGARGFIAQFNFHRDTAGPEAASKIQEELLRWNEYEQVATEMVMLLLGDES